MPNADVALATTMQDEILSLPMGPDLNPADVDFVIGSCRGFYAA